MYPSVKAARDVHVYMHSSTQPGSGPRLLLSFVCRLFPLQSRCFLSCLTFVPHSALEACWVTAEWPVLPFLGVSWSPPCWLFFLPIGCGHICTELFILRAFLPPSLIMTPQVLLCPLLVTLCFTLWWFTWCQAFAGLPL